MSASPSTSPSLPSTPGTIRQRRVLVRRVAVPAAVGASFTGFTVNVTVTGSDETAVPVAHPVGEAVGPVVVRRRRVVNEPSVPIVNVGRVRTAR